MREQLEKTKLKIGLVIFIGIAILLALIIMIGIDDYLFSRTYNLYIYTDNTAGLVQGAPVTLGGYKIGDVEAVEFVPVNNKTNIRVKLRIKNEYKDQIRKNSKARISSIGILGDKFIDLTIGNPEELSIAENSFLELEPINSLDNISQSIAPGLDNFNKIMENLKNVTDSISKGKGTVGEMINNSNIVESINRVIKKIDTALNAVENKNGTVYRLLNESELFDNLTTTSRELKTISNNIRNGKGTLGKLVANDSLYNNLNNASIQLNDLFHKTKSDSTVIGRLLNDKKLSKDIEGLLVELNELIVDIKEHPDKYINVSVF